MHMYIVHGHNSLKYILDFIKMIFPLKIEQKLFAIKPINPCAKSMGGKCNNKKYLKKLKFDKTHCVVMKTDCLRIMIIFTLTIDKLFQLWLVK